VSAEPPGLLRPQGGEPVGGLPNDLASSARGTAGAA
jgi:hypothetical protein